MNRRKLSREIFDVSCRAMNCTMSMADYSFQDEVGESLKHVLGDAEQLLPTVRYGRLGDQKQSH
jgi:hypothetical protein